MREIRLRPVHHRQVPPLLGLTAVLAAVVAVLATGITAYAGAHHWLVAAVLALSAVCYAATAVGVYRRREWAIRAAYGWTGIMLWILFWIVPFGGETLSRGVMAGTLLLFVAGIAALAYTYELHTVYLDRLPKRIRRLVAVAALVVAVATLLAIGTAFDVNWHLFANLTISGLGLGSIYALAAMGFAVIYKTTGVLNFAQGILVVVGAYSIVLLSGVGIPVPVAIVGALAFAIVLGLFLERAVFRHFIGEDELAVVIVTLALIPVFNGLLQAIMGGQRFRAYPDSLSIESVALPLGLEMRGSYTLGLLLAVVTVVVFVAFFRYTVLGSALRAASDDQQAASVLGISISQVIKISWALSILLAVLAGIGIGITHGGASFGLDMVIVFIFAAVIFGGLDSVLGAFVGSLVVGLLEMYGGHYYEIVFSPGFDLVLPMLFLLGVIVVKPYGIWGTERIERL